MEPSFISEYDWLQKHTKISSDMKLIMPLREVRNPLCNVEDGFKKFVSAKEMGEKIQVIQSIGLNLRSADKAYFNAWSKFIKRQNPFNALKDMFSCQNCYNMTISPNSLRNCFNKRLIELSDLNNEKVIHPMDSGNAVDFDAINLLKEYFDLIVAIDLTGFPALSELERRTCRDCKKQEQKGKNRGKNKNRGQTTIKSAIITTLTS